jgi:hypothetical protein
VREHVGPLEFAGDLGNAARLLERASTLVGPAFADQQIKEYAKAKADGRRSRHRLHPWIPGLYWHRLHVNTGFRGAPPREALEVLLDILALERIPGLLPEHEQAVVRRIRDGGEAALAELRVAAQYAPAGIVAEWSAVTQKGPSAPDVWIPAYRAEIEVKWLEPREAIMEDLDAVFGVLDDAWSQIDKRAARRQPGPAAIFIALPGATSLRDWSTAPVFQRSLSLRFSSAEFLIVSAIVFVTEPIIQHRGGAVLYGAPAWPLLNPVAAHPWPNDLPLSTDG